MNLAEANRILRLSDSQLAIVRQAAVPLSPSARDRYLKAVAADPVIGGPICCDAQHSRVRLF